MPRINSGLPRIVQLSLRAAESLGYRTRILDPEYGYLFEVDNGVEKRCFVGGMSPLNDAVAARIAQDKYYTSMLLADRGFRVVQGVRCLRADYFRVDDFSDRAGPQPGIDLANRVGYPVIVKPNRMALGRDVVAVHDESSLLRAIETVWKGDYLALVQRVAWGADVRLDFLDGTFLAGYRRHPIRIVGDGRSSLRALLVELDRRFADDETFGRRKAEPIWKQVVLSRGWDENTVLARGQRVSFENPVLNVNRWATAEVLDGVPDRWLRFCLSVAEVTGLRHFGLDLRVPAGEDEDWREVSPDKTVIIEVNASPALVQLHDLGCQDKAIAGQARVLRAAFSSPSVC